MLHFINQVQYYFVFEVSQTLLYWRTIFSRAFPLAQVLECAYDDLQRGIARATDLDDVIEAHRRFLAAVTQRALLGPESQVTCTRVQTSTLTEVS